MPTIKLHVQGDDAASTSDALRLRFVEAFGVAVEVRTETMRLPRMRGFDPLAIATFVLAVPSAILAAVELAERWEKRRKLSALLKDVRHRTARSDTRVLIDIDGRRFDLRRMVDDDLDRILDSIADDAETVIAETRPVERRSPPF